MELFCADSKAIFVIFPQSVTPMPLMWTQPCPCYVTNNVQKNWIKDNVFLKGLYYFRYLKMTL